MSQDDFDELMTALDPPMVIVTAAHTHEHGGCLVGFHAQSGLEPGNITVWLSKANHTFRVAVFAEHLAVHFLTSDDLELATAFGTTSGDDVDKFAVRRWQRGPGGVPLLEECPNRIVGRKMALLDTRSDHVCVVLDPIETQHRPPFHPLRLSDVVHLRAGHEAEERPTPPSTRAGHEARSAG
jgi:flavin reductase (DIM6/NTAB) family NADH-FMN oxidoreductase RutF